MSAERSYSYPHVEDWDRVSRETPCPICRKSDFCEVSNDGLVVHCMRIASDLPSTYRLGGWLHLLKTKASWAARKTAAPRNKTEKLSDEERDRMNRRAMDLLPDLIPAHLPLINPIDPAECRSFNRAISERVGTQLALEFGTDLADRLPALISSGTDEDGRPRYRLAAWHNGAVISYENKRTGILAGLQLRKETADKNNKYIWISNGTGGAPFGLEYVPGSTRIFLIEGKKKAVAGRSHFGDTFIYFSGVTAFDKQDLLKELDELGAVKSVIAFDQDKHKNKFVHDAELKLIRLLQEERPGLTVQTLEWPLEIGKGLDDALVAGFKDFEFKAVAAPRRKKVVTDLPLSRLTETFGNQVRQVLSIEQSHKAHANFAREHLLSKELKQIVIASPTGAGKSRAYDDEVTTLGLENKLPGRVLIVCPDKANVTERTAPGTKLHRLIQTGQARIQIGRQAYKPDAQPTEFDCRNIGQAHTAGEKRHIPAKSVCQACPFSNPEKWAQAYGDTPMMWNCQEKGYLASRKKSKAAQVVIATHKAYLNDSEELDDFDFVVVDEALMPLLMERIVIDKGTLAGWRERYGIYKGAEIKKLKGEGMYSRSARRELEREETHWLKLFDILDLAIAGMASTHAGELNPVALHPVMAAIKEAAGKLGVLMFDAWLAGTSNPPPSQGDDEIYPFEKPYSDTSHNGGPSELRFPLRAAYDLLQALKVGDQSIKAQRAQDGTFGLVITQVAGGLVERISNKSMAILDATPPPILSKLLPKLETKSFEIAQHLVISQTTNALFTKNDLNNPKTRSTIEAAIAKFLEGADEPLVMLPKRYEDGEKAIKVPLGALVGHWGKDDRATNKFKDCDRLVLLGHQERPIDYIQAEIEAVRVYQGETAPAQTSGDKLRLYNTVVEPGKTAAGRWCNSHCDPDVQAAIEHDYVAFIKQAIGRLRAALRTPDRPAEVLILCAEPVGDLKVDDLTTVQDLLKSKQEETPAEPATPDKTGPIKVKPGDDSFSLYIYGKNNHVGVLHSDEGYEGPEYPESDLEEEELPPDFWNDLPQWDVGKEVAN